MAGVGFHVSGEGRLIDRAACLPGIRACQAAIVGLMTGVGFHVSGEGRLIDRALL